MLWVWAMNWRSLRIVWLIAAFSGSASVLGYMAIAPVQNVRYQAAPYRFPENVPLLGWQLLAGKPLSNPKNQTTVSLSGWRYQYQQESRLLSIEMRYFAYAGIEDVRLMIQKHAALHASPALHYQPQVGSYVLLHDQRRAYLSACIPPRGPSTVTVEQFNQNGYLYNLRGDRLISWLVGQTPLVDDRCLWAHLSLPTEGSPPSNLYKILETVWPSWYQWWSSHFPRA
jgi:cyanosortase A-associated protein